MFGSFIDILVLINDIFLYFMVNWLHDKEVPVWAIALIMGSDLVFTKAFRFLDSYFPPYAPTCSASEGLG
jgi:hypothetical protein